MKREALRYFLLAILFIIIALFFFLPDKARFSPEIDNNNFTSACLDALNDLNSNSCKKGFLFIKNDNDRCAEGKCLLEKVNKAISTCCDNKEICDILQETREDIISYANHYCKEVVCPADVNVCAKFASVGNAQCRVLQDELRCPGCSANPDPNADPQKCQDAKSRLDDTIEGLKGFSCKTCYPELNYGNAFNCCSNFGQT